MRNKNIFNLVIIVVLTSFFGNASLASYISDGFPIEPVQLENGDYNLTGQNQDASCLQGQLRIIQINSKRHSVLLGARPLITSLGSDVFSVNEIETGCMNTVTNESQNNLIKSNSQTICKNKKVRESNVELTIINSKEFKYKLKRTLQGKAPEVEFCHLKKE